MRVRVRNQRRALSRQTPPAVPSEVPTQQTVDCLLFTAQAIQTSRSR